MVDFNTFVGAFKAFTVPQPRPAAGAAAAEATARIANDGFARSGSPALANASRGLALRVNQGDQMAAALKDEMAAPSTTQKRQMQIMMQLDELAARRGDLLAVKGEVDRMRANPNAKPDDIAKLAGLAQEAGGQTSVRRANQLVLEAKALARGTSDADLAAQQGPNNRIGDIEQKMRDLRAEAGQPITQKRMAQIQMAIEDLGRQKTALGEIAGGLERMAAANPPASIDDATRARALADEASQPNVTSHRLAQIGTEIDDLARNAGRAVKSDRGLFQATAAMGDRLAQHDQRMAALTAEAAQPHVTQLRLQQIQLTLDDLSRSREGYSALQTAAEILADKPGATPAATARMTALLTEAAQPGMNMNRLLQIVLEAADLAM